MSEEITREYRPDHTYVEVHQVPKNRDTNKALEEQRKSQEQLYEKRMKLLEQIKKKPSQECPRCRMSDMIQFVEAYANLGNKIQNPFRAPTLCSYRCLRCELKFTRPILDEVKEEKDVDVLDGVPVEV